MTHVLILFSDRQLAVHTSDYLKLKGYKVSAHTDPQQAITAADAQPPAVVVIDLLLANRSGVEFLYELRSYPEWQGIPVIITGYQQASDVRLFRPAFDQLNVASYLPAPLTSLARLEQEIRSLSQPVAA